MIVMSALQIVTYACIIRQLVFHHGTSFVLLFLRRCKCVCWCVCWCIGFFRRPDVVCSFNKSRRWVWDDSERMISHRKQYFAKHRTQNTSRTWWSSRWWKLPVLLGFCICDKGLPRLQFGAGKDWSKPCSSLPASFIKSLRVRLMSLLTSSSKAQRLCDSQNCEIQKQSYRTPLPELRPKLLTGVRSIHRCGPANVPAICWAGHCSGESLALPASSHYSWWNHSACSGWFLDWAIKTFARYLGQPRAHVWWFVASVKTLSGCDSMQADKNSNWHVWWTGALSYQRQ